MKKIILLAAAMMMAMSAQVMAADDEYIWHDEFDDMSKWKIDSTNKSASVSDGWLVVDAFDLDDKFNVNTDGMKEEEINRMWNDDFVKISSALGGVDVTPFPEIEVEIKIVFPDIEIPEGYGDAGSNNFDFPSISGKNISNDNMTWLHGGLYYGRFIGYDNAGNSKQVYPTDYWIMPRETELYWKITINKVTGKTNYVVCDKDGVELGSLSLPNSAANAKSLSSLSITIPESYKAKIDYIRIKALGVNVMSATTDKDVLLDKNIRTDAGMKLTFSHILDKDTLDGITLTDAAGDVVDMEITQDDVNKKLYNVFFPAGLKYDAEYTLMISDTVTSEDGKALNAFEKVFTTEASPFYTKKLAHRDQSGIVEDIGNISTSESIKSILTMTNNSKLTKNIEVVRVVYNSEGKVVKVATDSFEIVRSTDVKTTSTIDLTGLDAASMEVYIWDAFTGMHKIVE